ncbi:MAG: 30S ribosomal protein S9, partial [Candidatus Diapherotrites archaeon]|nr:30S ribosomal protein S9 [Candidatus Diapherotrites archaeon]
MEAKKKKRKGITTKAKKKTAVARAVIRKGSGIVRINQRNLESVTPKYLYEFIKEPLELAAPLSGEVDISVKVEGGGFVGQAVSARSAIAKALLKYGPAEKLKQKFLKYDRM